MATFENLTNSVRKRRDRSSKGRLIVAVPNVTFAAIRESLVPGGPMASRYPGKAHLTASIAWGFSNSSKSALGYCSMNLAFVSS